MPDAIIDGIGSGHKWAIESNNAGKVNVAQQLGTISTSNSSTTVIAANGSYVGTWEEVKDYSIVYNSIRTDEDSATNGLALEFSQDAVNVDVCEEYTVGSRAKGCIFSTQPSAQYFRVNYTNGGTDNTVFRLQTLYRPNYGKPSSHRADDPITDNNDTELVKSLITGKKPDGTYINIDATAGGNLKASVEEFNGNTLGSNNLPLNIASSPTVNLASQHNDLTTNSLKTINYEHYKIHAGEHYFICDFSTVNSGARVSFGVSTPSTTKWAHMTFSAQGTSQTEIRIYEGATISGGTAASLINNNRNSANTSVLTVSQDPTISGASPTSGTLLYSQSVGLAGVTPNAAPSIGIVDRDREIILKSGTSYIFEFKSVDDDNIISYCGNWYEHSNHN